MAEETDNSQKTEEPSQKRLDDAHQKGNVANSREVTHWFMMFAIVMGVVMFGPGTFSGIGKALLIFFESPHAIAMDPVGIQVWLLDLLLKVGLAMAPVFGLLVFAAISASLIQVGLIFTAAPMKPSFSKISPLAGLKRLFSLQSTMEFIKGTAKIAIVGVMAYYLLRPEMDGLERFYDFDMATLLAVLNTLTVRLIVGVLAVLAAIAVFDVSYTRISRHRKLRMSREELRDEHKESEGDPLVKGRLRQIRMERARRRMMQEVPKANVIITNPTHYAVALRYEQASMGAPKVVAKGTDLVARRIRELGEEHNIPIVSNPPLARALYATVELDQEVPPEHYKAVAEIIGYVMRLRRGGGYRPRA
jgi:flagellar biosynthetic protein FlhB